MVGFSVSYELLLASNDIVAKVRTHFMELAEQKQVIANKVVAFCACIHSKYVFLAGCYSQIERKNRDFQLLRLWIEKR